MTDKTCPTCGGNDRESPCAYPGEQQSGCLRASSPLWIAATNKPHPDKPGLNRYEQVPCLIVYKREILLRLWNCEHLVWDDEDGDDFFCEAKDVTHWMLLPALPSSAA